MLAAHRRTGGGDDLLTSPDESLVEQRHLRALGREGQRVVPVAAARMAATTPRAAFRAAGITSASTD